MKHGPFILYAIGSIMFLAGTIWSWINFSKGQP